MPSESRATGPSDAVQCVYLSCFEHDVSFFASMLGSTIRLHRADTLELADFLLLATDATVLLTDTTFLDGRWQDALAMADRVHQLVTTVICADPVDRPFLSKLHERGALEVLWMPLELHRLRSTIGRAHEVTVERRLWASSAHQAA